ncbi:hypothetical protein Trydic_g8686 [Trypoxylus dichotomus]
MQSLEAACEEGEVSSVTCCQCNQKSTSANSKSNMVCTHTRIFKKAKTGRSSIPSLQPTQDNVPTDIQTPKPPFCIHTKLKELYLDECAKNPELQSTGLKSNSHLLEKLVAQERLNTLIVNLYPGNKGYSLSFPTAPNSDLCDDTADMIETKQWPYEEEKLLRYIDNEELPAFFVDVLEPQYSFLFYSGCIVAEVRDYRQAYPHFKCDIHHVLLKPTLQSILADINIMMDEKVDWGSEEKQQLESQIILANNPKLYLEPNNSVSSEASRINHNRQLLNTHRLRRTARKYSQVSVNRKRKLDQFTHRPGLELYDYVTKLRSRSRSGASGVSMGMLGPKIAKKTYDDIKPIPVPSLESPPIGPPAQGISINEFKAYQRPRETSDCLPQLIEEYVLETDIIPSKEKGKPRVYHIKLSILQRPSNSEFLGELYLDRDHKKNERNGVACRFSLGSRAHANRYIQQFTEIFTEGGRKSVRINYGAGLKDRVAQVHAAQMQSQHAAQVNLAHQHLTQLSQNLQNQSCVTPLVNGTVGSSIALVQQNQTLQNASTVPILQTQLQSGSSHKTAAQTNQELEINALATRLMNSAQQFQAAANAKQQQQKLSSSTSNAAIINLLNSSPASNLNSDASAAVVNAINNATLRPQQVQTINQKLLGRKITLSNVPNARVLNHSNLIAVNNNRINLSDLGAHSATQSQQPQTITLTSVNSGNFIHGNYATIKQPLLNQRVLSAAASTDSSKSALSALLVGTPAADRPDIVGPNTNSLLLEKLAGASGTSPNPARSPTHFIQSPKQATAQYTVQSPKNNQVMSPLSSPPPQNSNTINVQSLNFTPIQNLTGLQNVQVQLPGFSQPISLSLNVSTGGIEGHPTGLIVSLPVTSATATCTTITQQQSSSTAVTAGNNIGVGTPTVVLTNAANSNLAHLVSSSVKGLSQQNLRAATPTGVALSQGGQPFQLVTQLQRPRIQQQAGAQQNLANRGIQRTPITIQMTAATNSNAGQMTVSESSTSINQLLLQKQTQHQQLQYQQMCFNNQQAKSAPQNLPTSKPNRRRANLSEQQ